LEGFGFAIDAIEHGWGDAIKRGQVKFAGIIDNPPVKELKIGGPTISMDFMLSFKKHH
jgi:hypothetical protein